MPSTPTSSSEGGSGSAARLVPLLVLLLLSSALATSTGGLDMDAFVPRADKWIADTITIIREFRVFPAMKLIGQTLVLAFFVVRFIQHWPTRNMAAIFRTLCMSVLATVLIGSATTNAGVVGQLFTTPLTIWQKAYVASTTAVRPKLQAGVVKDTRDLALTMNSFITNSMMSVNAMAAFNGGQIVSAEKSGGDGSKAASAAADQAVESVKARSAQETSAMRTMTWLYQAGYLLLLGFFMAFAGVIYFSAMSVIFGMIALPVALAFWAGGNGTGLKLILTTWITAIITVTLTPPLMMVATNMALGQPTVYIKSQIDPLNTQARATMQQYAATYQACASRHKDDWFGAGGLMTEVCGTTGNFGLFASTFGSAVLKVALGLVMMIMIMVVSIGVGAALIRAIPGLLSGLLGGGIGSGAPAMSVGGAMSRVASAARTAGAAASLGGAALGKGAESLAEGGRKTIRAYPEAERKAVGAYGAVQNYVQDRAAVRSYASSAGVTGAQARATLHSQGALPSQVRAAQQAQQDRLTVSDAGAARAHAAQHNAVQEARQVTTPGYVPQRMTAQQAHARLVREGKLPSQNLSPGNPMRGDAGTKAS